MLRKPLKVKTLNALIDACKLHGIMLSVRFANEMMDGVYYQYVLNGYPLESKLPDDEYRGVPCCTPTDDCLPVTKGLRSGFSLIYVKADLIHDLHEQINKPGSELYHLSNIEEEYTFIYLDISDYSKFPPGQQALVINSLRSLINDKNLWISNANKVYFGNNHLLEVERLCIGDGYIFCIKDNLKAVYFASHLAGLIDLANALERINLCIHFRIGLHREMTFRFWDEGRNGWNFVGEGINGSQRVQSAIGKNQDDVIFVSNAVKEAVQRVTDDNVIRRLTNRGRIADKHHKLWRVFELDFLDLFLNVTKVPGKNFF